MLCVLAYNENLPTWSSHFWKGGKAQAPAFSVSGKGPGLRLKSLLVFLVRFKICVSFFMADRNNLPYSFITIRWIKYPYPVTLSRLFVKVLYTITLRTTFWVRLNDGGSLKKAGTPSTVFTCWISPISCSARDALGDKARQHVSS